MIYKWILKVKYSFNKYIGENKEIVSSIIEAKEFKTKKSATQYSHSLEQETEVLKKILN